ncbi:hypothetical protein F0P96_01070 [Hymenobacter busanensis]|uniref:Uncharacterized protein n=1 Tax=Hymenobacter busanensis TaxID=2607656 RepID=A0A7L4ZUW5_9BACT|nr:hypothetical protein [Hymenobacter busanensis]KAA9339247.1 hypothetical protein F0P96_01070 [Hymenobacter busanensis]QHJ06991.1 hypothetical protein GUY19_06680 [Hymenobacter busanensis]
MNTVYFDSPMPDSQRREELYAGQLFAFQPRPSVMALVEFGREFVREAFGDVDPALAQHTMSPEAYNAILADFKPRFINHEKSKQLVQNLLLDFGCDPEKTYFDVPRMRTVTSHNFLTHGLAYRFDTHRDTWFSAPLNQLNWWFPMYEHESGNALAFHPNYWNRGVANGSENYHMHEWYAEGARLAAAGEPDKRERPRAYDELELLEPQVRLVLPPGGVTIFSAAQMHSTVVNQTGRTRYSIDFRTVHIDDVRAHRGAPNHDSASTGTNLIDFFRVSDLARLPKELTNEYEPGTPLLDPAVMHPVLV